MDIHIPEDVAKTIAKFLTKDGIGELPEWTQEDVEKFVDLLHKKAGPEQVVHRSYHEDVKANLEGELAAERAKKTTGRVSYHIRVYSPDSLEWRETFYTEDFDTALGEWQGECEGESYNRRVELVEERIVEVSEP